jgi:uncharacterized protein YcaQ
MADGTIWYWPAEESLAKYSGDPEASVRLLTPFDPVVWDRRRFRHFWGWEYRFEAYVPRNQRKLGYYALPLLWRDDVVGWGNLSVRDGRLVAEVRYVNGRPPKGRIYSRELDAELARVASFLRLT